MEKYNGLYNKISKKQEELRVHLVTSILMISSLYGEEFLDEKIEYKKIQNIFDINIKCLEQLKNVITSNDNYRIFEIYKLLKKMNRESEIGMIYYLLHADNILISELIGLEDNTYSLAHEENEKIGKEIDTSLKNTEAIKQKIMKI